MGASAYSMDERFWRKVNKTSSCWLWTGAVFGHGYGQLTRNKRHFTAHRFSWLMHYGPIPATTDVCHLCDIPACVNPGHLFLGTRKDNMADMVKKGRQSRVSRARGENNAHAKLNADQVREIRKQLVRGVSEASLATAFSVGVLNINRIKRRVIWRHI